MINSFFNKLFMLKWNIFILKVFYFNLMLSISVISAKFNKFLILIKLIKSTGSVYFI